MSLCEAPNGRRSWPDLEAPWELIGAHRRGEGEGEGEERQGGAWSCYAPQGAARGGGHGALQGLVRCCSCCAWGFSVLCVRKEKEKEKEKERRRKERRKRKKEGKEKKKNMKKISNLKISKK
jgi:hypothetical protein